MNHDESPVLDALADYHRRDYMNFRSGVAATMAVPDAADPSVETIRVVRAS